VLAALTFIPAFNKLQPEVLMISICTMIQIDLINPLGVHIVPSHMAIEIPWHRMLPEGYKNPS
jgi:hypothetical protein